MNRVLSEQFCPVVGVCVGGRFEMVGTLRSAHPKTSHLIRNPQPHAAMQRVEHIHRSEKFFCLLVHFFISFPQLFNEYTKQNGGQKDMNSGEIFLTWRELSVFHATMALFHKCYEQKGHRAAEPLLWQICHQRTFDRPAAGVVYSLQHCTENNYTFNYI